MTICAATLALTRLTLIIALGSSIAGCDFFETSDYRGATAFDAATWRSGELLVATPKEAPRLRMADGLVADRALIGKTKPQILEMLGPPTDTDKFSDHGLVYWLGPERGFMSIDSEWLIADFDAQGICTHATIFRD